MTGTLSSPVQLVR